MAGFAKTKGTSNGGGFLKQDTGQFTIPSGSSADRNLDAEAGDFRFNTDTSVLEYYDGSSFRNVNRQGVTALTLDQFTGDGSTVDFVMSASVTSNEATRILVAVGNVFQNQASAYTLDGTKITFTSAPPSSESITIIHGLDSNIPI
jgi:hypothetical protein